MVKISATIILEIDVLSRKIHLRSHAKCIQIFLLVIFNEMIFFRSCVVIVLFSHKEPTLEEPGPVKGAVLCVPCDVTLGTAVRSPGLCSGRPA